MCYSLCAEVIDVASYFISGGEKLKGTVKIQGSKNAALPIIAASLLHRGTTVIRECPWILDVRYMLDWMQHFHRWKYSVDRCIGYRCVKAGKRVYRKDAVIHFAPRSYGWQMRSVFSGLSGRMYDWCTSGGYTFESS